MFSFCLTKIPGLIAKAALSVYFYVCLCSYLQLRMVCLTLFAPPAYLHTKGKPIYSVFSKRKEIFNWLRKKISIYMLQEVHCTENNVHLWTAESYKALFSCCSSNKAGTCILFNNNFDLQINKTRSDPNGRFIICDINTNGTSFTLCNLYAPNEDRPEFFQRHFQLFARFSMR